jgi:DNA-binding CsgD family transcriptional regulator
MELHDAVRIGVDAAHQVVRGEDYSAELTERVFRVFGADGGAGVMQWRVAGGRVVGIGSARLSASGVAPLTPPMLAAAGAAADRHPTFAAMIRGRTHERLSDVVQLERFWDTDVYESLHGHSEGRFPAAVLLARSPGSLTFLGIHRQVRDLDDDELACFTALAEPLRAALAFRDAMDRAVARLGQAPGGTDGPFTSREAEVIVLVSRGWTTERIARRLGVSPTAVKNRLASARDRVGAASRSELVARWAQEARML